MYSCCSVISLLLSNFWCGNTWNEHWCGIRNCKQPPCGAVDVQENKWGFQNCKKSYFGTPSHVYSCCSVWTRTLVGCRKLQRASLQHTFPLLSCYSYGLLHLHVGAISVVFANNLHCCVDLSQHCPLRGVPVCHITLENASALMSFNTNVAVSMLECTSLFLWNRLSVTVSRLYAINVTSLVFVMLYWRNVCMQLHHCVFRC
jgi:hypothetical protein